MVYQEESLTCVECNNSFAFTAEEQAYHAERGFTNKPKRCSDCRQARRSRSSYGGGGTYDRPQREMHMLSVRQRGRGTVPAQGRPPRLLQGLLQH